MQTRPLGQTEMQITPMVLGTWQAGKRGWVGIEEEQIIQAIQAAWDAGVTTVDTAEIYGDGYSETVVGKALVGRRDRTILATKVFPNHLQADQVMTACEDSLQRLQTDYIDLYQIHWPAGAFKTPLVPIAETMGALVKLKEQGKIRAIGVSNFSLAQLQEALQYGPIESVQPPYSLFWRQIEADILPFCQEHTLTILAYSSLAQGLLTGRFGPGHTFPPEDIRSRNKLFQGELYEKALVALAQLRPIADRHHTTLGNLALAWLMAQPQTHAIVGVRNAEQARENAQAVEVSLAEADLAEIDRIGRTVTAALDTDPVMWDFTGLA